MISYSKSLEGPWPPAPYAYVRAVYITYM